MCKHIQDSESLQKSCQLIQQPRKQLPNHSAMRKSRETILTHFKNAKYSVYLHTPLRQKVRHGFLVPICDGSNPSGAVMCYGWREAEKPLILVRATKTRKHIPYLMAEQVTIRCDGNCFRTQIGGLPVSLIGKASKLVAEISVRFRCRQ